MSWVVWITGLPGSGKSTVASAVKEKVSDAVVLQMDVLRKVVTPDPSYSEEEREHVYRAIVYTAKTLGALGHKVIIDATGNRRSWRDLARELIPDFFEVYLECSLDTSMDRERTRTDTHAAPSAIYEKPERPDLVINTEKVSAGDAADMILEMLRS